MQLGENMEQGKFYFVSDEFYQKYKKYGLTGNDGDEHGRPCCYLFKADADDIYWMVPISSKTEKYQQIYKKSVKKYGLCDNVVFGYVLGRKRAFLVQNLFPVTLKYITSVYIDKQTGKPVEMDHRIEGELRAKARKKIDKASKGIKIGLTDIASILSMIKGEIHAG